MPGQWHRGWQDDVRGEPIHEDLPLLGGGLIDECLQWLLARTVFVGMQHHRNVACMRHQRDMVEAGLPLGGSCIVDGAAEASVRRSDEQQIAIAHLQRQRRGGQ